MNSRFAEPCRDSPLELLTEEKSIFAKSRVDGRTAQELACQCDKDIFVGFFFDGTNNKYRDTFSQSHSNVARLHEVFPGTPATQTNPKLLPKVTTGRQHGCPLDLLWATGLNELSRSGGCEPT